MFDSREQQHLNGIDTELTETYINHLDGLLTVLLSGVVHKGTLVIQKHLDAVDRSSSERRKAKGKQDGKTEGVKKK